MFKSARWRSEKNKTKAVFQLQFQATQVPQMKAKTLSISVVPADVGKPTVKLEKTAIVDGTCYWENPVYETVKLIRETKSGSFCEKCYFFIVSTGSSKSGLLGQVAINFADYAELVKPSTLSLPVLAANNGETGAILHVTIHLMQDSADRREIETTESPIAKSKERSWKNHLQNNDINGNSNLNSIEDEYIRENPVLAQDDTTLRHNSIPNMSTVDSFPKNSHVHQRSDTDWSVGSASDGSFVDSPNSPEENLPTARPSEVSGRSTDELERKISTLERHAELSELELQSLRKQIVKETKRGQDLSRQIVILKEEKEALKAEYQQFTSSPRFNNDAEVSSQSRSESKNLKATFEEIKKDLTHEKKLNTTLRSRLQKIEDSNSELVLTVRDLNKALKKKDGEIARLSSTTKTCQNEKEASQKVTDCNNEAFKVDMLKQRIADLQIEIEVYMKDTEELKTDKEQLSIDYEILRRDNKDISLKLERNEKEKINMQNECSEYLATIEEFKVQMESLEKEMENKALQLLESSDTISELENHVKNLEIEIEKQAQGYEIDLEGITRAKMEQEQRAIGAEEALRKTRSNNTIAIERVQEEFRRVSLEMSSKFDENEKLAMEAVTEANNVRLQKKVLEEMLQRAKEEIELIKEKHEGELQEASDQKDLKSKEIEQISKDLEEKCCQLENMKKQEEKLHKYFSSKIENLKSEIKRSSAESNDRKKTKKLTGEQVLEQGWNEEKEVLKREFDLARKEAEKLEEESNTLRSMKNEKERMVGVLQSETETLKAQYNDLKQSFLEVGMEKENLRKEVSKLEGDLRRKEEKIIIVEKKLDSNSVRTRNSDTEEKRLEDEKNSFGEKGFVVEDAARDGKLTTPARELNRKVSKMDSIASTFKANGTGTASDKGKVETCSEKGMNISTLPKSDDCHLTQLLREMELLKERNQYMEGELKDMQERYSEISLKFAEVEGERQQLVMTVRNLKNSKKI